jgi:hypothetical protein
MPIGGNRSELTGATPMTIKVVQWATGAIGKTCLRAVIDHPDLELVGLYVHSAKKIGQDAGSIARRDLTGVIATGSIDEIIALEADVVLYTPLNPSDSLDEHDAIIKRLLASGKNVITTIAHVYPQAFGEHYAKGFEDACREGNSTLFGTGINPGFVAERLTVLLTGLCTRIDRIVTTEVYDVSEVQSAAFIFDLMGIGKPLEVIAEGSRVKRVFNHIFGELVAYVGHALQIEFDEVRADHEFGVANRDVTLPVGVVPQGGVVNFRWRWHGMKDSRPFFTIQMLWIADRQLSGWDLPDGWTVDITGAPGLHLKLDLVEPQGLPDRSKAMQYCVAAPVIRSIPDVVAAPPGVLLPPVFAAFSPRIGVRR